MIARGNEGFEPSERTVHARRPGGSLLAIETGPDFGSPALSMMMACPRCQTAMNPAEPGISVSVDGPGSSRVRENPDFQIGVSGSQIRLYMESNRHARSASRLKNAG
jgi:hypothetical protein